MALRLPATFALISSLLTACGGGDSAGPLAGLDAVVGTWVGDRYEVTIVGVPGTLPVNEPVTVTITADSSFAVSTSFLSQPFQIAGTILSINQTQMQVEIPVQGGDPMLLTVEYSRSGNQLELTVRGLLANIDLDPEPEELTIRATVQRQSS